MSSSNSNQHSTN